MGVIQSVRAEEVASPNQHVGKPSPLDQCTVKVQKIHINGLNHTKDDIATHQVQSIFDAENFLQLVRQVNTAKARLLRIGCFRDVNVFIDTSKEGLNGYEVYFEVEELKRLAGGVTTQVGTNEGGLLLSGRLPNTLGRGQKLQLDYQYGTNKATGISATYSQPMFLEPDIRLTAGLGQSAADVPWSRFSQRDRGLFAGVTFPTWLGHLDVQWNGMWRELDAMSSLTSFAVREQCGHSMKFSLSGTFTQDTRDNSFVPNEGRLLKLTQEVAGFGGDVGFSKTQLDAQYNISLPLDMVLQVSGRLGQITSLPGNWGANKSVRICDRFFVGGPLTVRGFKMRGIGPHSEGDALGGSAQLQAAAHLYAPLPLGRRSNFFNLFRLQGFCCAGNNLYTYLSALRPSEVLRLAQGCRYSAGVGIVTQLGSVARVELNYCFPFSALPGEKVQQGFQFGIGIEYL